jgi:hypothetical protein
MLATIHTIITTTITQTDMPTPLGRTLMEVKGTITWVPTIIMLATIITLITTGRMEALTTGMAIGGMRTFS